MQTVFSLTILSHLLDLAYKLIPQTNDLRASVLTL